MKKKYSLWLVVVLCAVCAAAASAGTLAAVLRLEKSRTTAFDEKIDGVRSIISGSYVGETDWAAVADGAAEGMIEALGDRWSYYMTAEEYESYKQFSTNTASGIGVTVSADEGSGGFLIESVTEDSPAQRAGAQAGQIIVSAAGEDVRGMKTTELRSIIATQEGEFPLVVLNPDGSETTLTVSTEVIYTNPVSHELLDGDIGYVRIKNFELGAAENAEKAVEALMAEGAKSLLFDVRSNPGGRLDELIGLLDYLLPEGDIFISIGRDGDEKVYTSDSSCISMPMAALINADSYSAAEFFAAVLREYGAAVIVGEPSTGKGRSQVTYELADGSAVHISTRRYLTPRRVDLSEAGGLVPDIEVQPSTDSDAQLEEAIKYLS